MMMRKWMIDLRRKKGMSSGIAAIKAHCSPKLLEYLEHEESITHPICAARIATVYGMNVDQYNDIVHENHRADVLPDPAPLPTDDSWRVFLKKLKTE